MDNERDFSSVPDPEPDSDLCRTVSFWAFKIRIRTDPDLAPSIDKQKILKNLDFNGFLTS